MAKVVVGEELCEQGRLAAKSLEFFFYEKTMGEEHGYARKNERLARRPRKFYAG